ncbi:MAG TPA: DUF4296 domain-containing protein [Flavobacteriaceae bacterium]|mgnify:CR=1 FL=1|nr:DUF4296 domain-containing protein [Flavobacteriaceae bacterium]MCB9214110.1 DUF4296 domain-containing protein [Alteromonas sp.]HPF11549.1 DUF4296 domain-containing protein [Flavobacteriaceae bacterium]HQU21082.1 DUF4296 domain-containing protein [Flavobacteriaceae bacterium]HQU65234.1 DUF4296 domain-containing protein [Flavobacteriaceae bacterium]
MKRWLYILVLLSIISCQDVKWPDKPKNLIPKETMVEILAESYTGNAARSVKNRVIRDAGIHLDSLIYSKYGVDSLSFAQSNTYYASQLNEYLDIMKRVEAKLEAKKALIDTTLAQETQKRQDSLKAYREAQIRQSDSLRKAVQD